MAIIKIQKWQFVPRDQIDDVIRSISLNEQEKNGFSSIWSTFSTSFPYSTTKTGKYVKEVSLSFPNLKPELKNSYWFVFYCLSCLGHLSKLYAFFLGHSALSQFPFKILS